MIVDCDRCAVRGDACTNCVITVLLGTPPAGIELDSVDRWALHTLAEAGMVPRLQLVDQDEDFDDTRTDSTTPYFAERSPNCGERSKRHVS